MYVCQPNIINYTSDPKIFYLASGGMETQETTKPDLVFDGELNFEKGGHIFLSIKGGKWSFPKLGSRKISAELDMR